LTMNEIVDMYNGKYPKDMPEKYQEIFKGRDWKGIVEPSFIEKWFGINKKILIAVVTIVGIILSTVAGMIIFKRRNTPKVSDLIKAGEPFDTTVETKVTYTPQVYNGRLKVPKVNLLPMKIKGISQGGWNHNQKEEDQLRKIRRNVVSVTMLHIDSEGNEIGEGMSLHGTFMDCHTLVVPEHLFSCSAAIQSSAKVMKIRLYNDFGKEFMCTRISVDELNSTRFVVSEGQRVDLRLIKTSAMPGIKDISKFLVDSIPSGALSTLIGGREGHTHDVSAFVEGTTITDTQSGPWLVIKLNNKDGITMGGDCGRPWVIVNKSEVRIVGLHSCIFGSGCYGVTGITKDYYNIGKLKLKIDDHIESQNQCVLGEPSTFQFGIIPSTSRTTNFVRTSFKYDEFENEWLPSAKGYKILQINANKYIERGILDPPTVFIDMVLTHFYNQIDELSPLVTRVTDIYSLEKALNGTGCMRSIVLSTSCGYIKFSCDKKGKNDYLVRDEQSQKLGYSEKARTELIPILGNKTFVEHMEFAENEINNRRCFKMVWISTLKDEMRSVEKVKAGKTRVFEQPGLDYLILCRKYFGSFLDWFKSNWGTRLGHAIGIDKEVEWKKIAEELFQFSNCTLVYDYKNFDGSIRPWCFDVFNKITDYFYCGEGKNARDTLIYMLKNSDLLVGNLVNTAYLGNKSGNPFTDVFNSVSNVSIMLVVYLFCKAQEGLYVDLTDFRDNVRMLTYGDDIIATVKPRALNFFNGISIQEVSRFLGFDITSADKLSEIRSHYIYPLHKDKISFLKSTFEFEEGLWKCPLPMSSIVRELMWVPNLVVGDPYDWSARLCNVARFLVHVGRHAFDEFKERALAQGAFPYCYDDMFNVFKLKQIRGIQDPWGYYPG